jgi:hypothetical protein
MPETMQSEPSRTSKQRQSWRRGRGRRREVVNAEEDIAEADEDEALHRACHTRERVGDEGTARCCQYRASEGRNYN